jgi:hypothetical protein
VPTVPASARAAPPDAARDAVPPGDATDERTGRVAPHGAASAAPPRPPGGAGARVQRASLPELFADAGQIGPLSWPGTSSESYTARVLRIEGRARFYEEMFAEAFSMWRADREALQDQAPALVRWFDQRNHLR